MGKEELKTKFAGVEITLKEAFNLRDELNQKIEELRKEEIRLNTANYTKIDLKIVHEELERFTGVTFDDVLGIKIIVAAQREFPDEDGGGITGNLQIILKEPKKHLEWYEHKGERKSHEYDRDFIYIDDTNFVLDYFTPSQVWFDSIYSPDIKVMLSEELIRYIEANPSFKIFFNDEEVVDLLDYDPDAPADYFFSEDWDT